jgi:hypothetical protein
VVRTGIAESTVFAKSLGVPTPIPCGPSSVSSRTYGQFFHGFLTTYVSAPVIRMRASPLLRSRLTLPCPPLRAYNFLVAFCP